MDGGRGDDGLGLDGGFGGGEDAEGGMMPMGGDGDEDEDFAGEPPRLRGSVSNSRGSVASPTRSVKSPTQTVKSPQKPPSTNKKKSMFGRRS